MFGSITLVRLVEWACLLASANGLRADNGSENSHRNKTPLAVFFLCCISAVKVQKASGVELNHCPREISESCRVPTILSKDFIIIWAARLGNRTFRFDHEENMILTTKFKHIHPLANLYRLIQCIWLTLAFAVSINFDEASENIPTTRATLVVKLIFQFRAYRRVYFRWS